MLNPLLRGKSVDSGDNRTDHHYSIHQGIVVLFIINAHQEGDQGSSGGEGFHDEEHLELITTPRGKMLGFNPENVKKWIMTWNEEFGKRLGAIYPTGDE